MIIETTWFDIVTVLVGIMAVFTIPIVFILIVAHVADILAWIMSKL